MEFEDEDMNFTTSSSASSLSESDDDAPEDGAPKDDGAPEDGAPVEAEVPPSARVGFVERCQGPWSRAPRGASQPGQSQRPSAVVRDGSRSI